MLWSRLIRGGLVVLAAMNLFMFHVALAQSSADAEVTACDGSGCKEKTVQVFLTDDVIKLLPEWGKSINITVPPHKHLSGDCWRFTRTGCRNCHVFLFPEELFQNLSQWLDARNEQAPKIPAQPKAIPPAD